MNRKFVSYRRVSTSKQLRSGLGLQAQKNIIDYFVKSENGELIADFEECYTGTELANCVQLQRAIDLCKRENATLIIAKTDRFRNTIEALQIMDAVGEKNIFFCDLPQTDRFTLTLFFAISEREALLISLRTKQALQAKKERGEKLGRAASKYTINEEKQQEGAIKSAKTRNENNIKSNDFLAFCRILKRTYDMLNKLSSNDDLFMLKWNDYKSDFLKSITKDSLFVVLKNMKEVNEDNSNLFANYNLDDSNYMLRIIRAKINNVFRTIETYSTYN